MWNVSQIYRDLVTRRYSIENGPGVRDSAPLGALGQSGMRMTGEFPSDVNVLLQGAVAKFQGEGGLREPMRWYLKHH